MTRGARKPKTEVRGNRERVWRLEKRKGLGIGVRGGKRGWRRRVEIVEGLKKPKDVSKNWCIPLLKKRKTCTEVQSWNKEEKKEEVRPLFILFCLLQCDHESVPELKFLICMNFYEPLSCFPIG